jgi:uncharacterized surface protein with fasciclin (FAS1) repeats
MKTKHLTQSVLAITMAAFIPAAYAEPKLEEKVVVQEKATVQPGTLTTVIADSLTFSTLTAALKAADLDVTLGSKDEFTVFAPTDEAFGKLPEGTLTKLLLPENKEKLRMLLLYHVVAGKITAGEMIDGEVQTVNGEKLTVKLSENKIEVNGSKVFSIDVPATNGFMHGMGEVLVPKSLEGFAGLKK